jgi:uncharacterized protein (TIGR03435 family)
MTTHPAPALKFFLRRSLLLIAATLTIACPILLAQTTASPAPSFDVATIKPLPPDGRPTHGWSGVQTNPDGMEAASLNLSELLCYAYGYNSLRFEGQVSGLPDWALTQRYDIVAKIGEADMPAFRKLSNDEQEKQREAMMQSLLAERFHLTLHHGAKQIPVYVMVVAKGGIKMRDAATDPAPPQLGKGDDGKPLSTLRWGKDTTLMQAESMKYIANLLSMPAAQVGRPVLDKTGLTSTYNFTLNWSIYSASAAANSSPDNDATSIFTALGELGLKLQPATASFDTLVIDHVEKPTEN